MSKSIALVLASGGARGMAHIGVIEELEKHNFKISAVAGSSFGAVVGGIYATGHLKEFKNWLLELDKMDVFRLMDFTLSTHGFIKANKVFNEIKDFITDIKIEDLPLPFIAVAVDPHTQQEVTFKSGSLYDAIRASVAVPGVIEPYIIDGKELIDGGVLNPIPMDLVSRKDNDLMVAVNINATIPYQKKKKISFEQKKKEQSSILKRLEFNERWEKLYPKDKQSQDKYSYIALLNLSYDMMQNKIINLMLAKHKPDILVNISRYVCSTFDFFKAEEIIQLGKDAFNIALAEYDKKVIQKYMNLAKP
jgi:NTE family protein